MRRSTIRSTRGFVLPTTLLVTTLLTVMLTAAFILVSAEHRTTDNSLAGARALSLAQAGVQTYLAANRGIGSTTTYDSVRYALSDGYADVVTQRLRPAAGSSMALWVVRSSGYSTDPRLGGQTQGKRVVAQLTNLNPGVLPARAAMVAANGVEIIGPTNANPITGDDLGGQGTCTPPPGAAADTFALTAPVGGYTAPSGTNAPGGVGIDSLPNYTAVIDSTRIDWTSLLAGNFVPDYTIPGSAWPPTGSNNYLVGYAIGDVTIPAGQRRGMLVVQGNVSLSNNTHWDGIIVAGGKLVTPTGSGSTYRIHGMIITGLNLSQTGPGTVLKNQVFRWNSGTQRIQWTWCYTRFSVSALNAMVPIRNGWVDTWTTY